jgi:hypothetical protein
MHSHMIFTGISHINIAIFCIVTVSSHIGKNGVIDDYK